MRLLSLLLGLILSWGVLATIDTYRFSSVEQEQQYRALTEQLRCPKCQNNSIADSNATIAADMRAKVYELMQQGYSKQQIVDYMVARYGNFVTYEPPVTAATINSMGRAATVCVNWGGDSGVTRPAASRERAATFTTRTATVTKLIG